MGLSNLPPGVSQRDIDRYFSGPCVDCEEGNHGDCSDSECRCEECDEAAREDAAELRWEIAREDRMAERYE